MIRIVTDSTSGISQIEASELNIDVVPLYVFFNKDMYKDGVDFTNEEFYELLKDNHPTTSQPTPVDFLNVFNKYDKDEIICITLSEKLSGTYQSANIAKGMSDNKNICVIDSANVSVGLRNLVFQAIKMRNNNLKADEIITKITALKDKVVTLGMADKLDNFKRGGRISHVKFFAGNLLNIKAMIIVENGMLEAYNKKARGKNKALNIIANSLQELNYNEELLA